MLEASSPPPLAAAFRIWHVQLLGNANYLLVVSLQFSSRENYVPIMLFTCSVVLLSLLSSKAKSTLAGSGTEIEQDEQAGMVNDGLAANDDLEGSPM